MAVLLSVLPIPAWLQPLDYFESDDPWAAISASVFRYGASSGSKEGHGDVADITDGEGPAEDPQKTEVIPTAARARTRWTAPPREKYEEMRRQVNASPLPVVVPCVEPAAGEGCTRFALDRFFAKLAAAEAGEEGATVRVVHFGDSLIASDHITDLVRQRLHERFGSGGRGMLLVDRLSRFAGRRVRTGNASPNWTLDVITMANPKDRFFGYTGASFTATKDGESSEFDVGVNRDVEIHYLAYEGGGELDIEADGKKVGTIDMRATPPEPRIHTLTLPEGTALMRLVARTKGPRIFGVSLEAKVPGVVYESLGLPGATSEVWLVPDEKTFAAQLVARKPSLIVTMLGGNDGLMLSKKRTTIEDIEKNTTAFIERIRRALPDTDCLMVSPMDAARVKNSGEMTSKPEVREVKAVLEKVAAAQGCAYWDMWTSMGGEGALERWWNAKMINPDMIHPRGYGGDLLGELMVTAVMEAYDVQHPPTAPVAAKGTAVAAAASPSASPEPHVIRLPPVLVVEPIQIRIATQDAPPPATVSGEGAVKVGALEDPGGRSLDAFFEKLERLENERTGRAAVAMFGSTHVSTHRLADALRGKLAPRFGDRGRGFVPVGRYTKTLSDAGTERVLKGAFDVFDGRAAVEGKPALFGMSGTRTELRRGGQFIFVPCTQCDSSVGAGVFDVFFWSAPGMAWAKVTVSGSTPQIVGRSPAQRELGVRRYATDAARPRLDVEVEGPGTLTLFGVAHELDRPGVVVDPIALAGTTPGVMLRWDPDIVMGMIARRRADMIVVAYGEIEAQTTALDVPAYRRDLARVLRRLRIAAAEAPCLVLGPAPSLRNVGGQWEEWPAVEAVETLQREAARAEGCAFWSTREGIGGAVEMRRWATDGTGRTTDDRAFLGEPGLAEVGERLARDLMADFDRWRDAGGTSARAAN